MIESLTDREKEILTLVTEGKSNKDIARLLIISYSTVKTHLNNIFNKTGVHSREKLIIWVYHKLMNGRSTSVD